MPVLQIQNNIKEGTCTIGCDNKGALSSSFGWKKPRPKWSLYDLVCMIRHQIKYYKSDTQYILTRLKCYVLYYCNLRYKWAAYFSSIVCLLYYSIWLCSLHSCNEDYDNNREEGQQKQRTDVMNQQDNRQIHTLLIPRCILEDLGNI